MVHAEDQIEIAEGIKVAKVRTLGRDALVILFEQNFGAAKRVIDRL
jgi:hypothetical protein